jgi:molecular chaperone DnaJ
VSQKDWIEKDFYATLGVPKDASAAEIKKAFRTLAKKHHPDSNENDPKAEARFKEVSEAYDVLSDEKTRKEYDEARSLFGGGFRPPGGFGGGANAPFDLSDLLGRAGGGGGFGDVFGGIFNRGPGTQPGGRRPRRGADVESTVTLSFDEALEGLTLPLRLTSDAPCGVCSGTGPRHGCARRAPARGRSTATRAASRSPSRAVTVAAGVSSSTTRVRPAPEAAVRRRRARCRHASRRVCAAGSGSGSAARAPRASTAARRATCSSSSR